MTNATGNSTTSLGLRARLVMDSDWHVGTGAGRSGHIDRLVARDEGDLPYVPAKTLTGVWRDACERLTWGLDGGNDGRWSAWVNYLFGSQPALAEGPVAAPPRPAALAVRAAHLPEPLRQALAAAGELREALTFVKPGVSIDEETGQAKEKFLRFEEMARAGAVLEAECALDVPADPEVRQTALALLTASAALVERTGGKRRRGSGRCRLELLDGLGLDDARAWLEAREEPPPVPAAPGGDSMTTTTSPIARDEWVEVPLVVHLRSALSVPYRVVGNVGETFDFLPGHMLLPLLTRAGRDRGVDLSEAIGAGDVIALPATVETGDDRGRPVPFALALPKGAGFGDARNLFRETDKRPLKQLRAGYVGATVTGQLPEHVLVRRIVRTHNSVEDREQRPSEATGGVYSYEAIAAVTRLRTVIRMRKSVAALLADRDATWWESLGRAWTFGRSKKDDYGQAVIEVGGAPGPSRVPPSARDVCDGDQLVVWCLSDVLLRDEMLRPVTSVEALAGALSLALGPGIELRPDPERVQLRVRRFDSWQTRWGLPRPTLVTIAAGSCAALTVVKGPISTEALTTVALAGIGERRAEGYGQLGFDDPLITEPLAGWTPAQRPSSDATPRALAPIEAEGAAVGYAQLVERAAWRSILRRRIAALAADPDFREAQLAWPKQGDRPPATQLNALREAARRAEQPSPRSQAARWLERLGRVKNRMEKWPAGALDRARTLLIERNGVWALLGAGEEGDGRSAETGPRWPTLTRGAEERLREELWAEAVQALIGEAARQHLRARGPRASAGREGS